MIKTLAKRFGRSWLLVLFLAGGCAGRSSYYVRRLDDSVRFSVPHSSTGRELLISVNDADGTFRLFGRADHDRYLIRDVSVVDGSICRRGFVPRFSDHYWHDYGFGLGFAVSPSGNRVAYADTESRSLCVFEAVSGARSVVATNFARNVVDVRVLEWLSDTELLAGSSQEGVSDCALLWINAASGQTRQALRLPELSIDEFALSPTGPHMALWVGDERHSIYGRYVVFDLATMGAIAEVRARAHPSRLHGPPRWAPSGEEFAYLEDNAILAYNLKTRSSRVLFAGAGHKLGRLLCYTGDRAICSINPLETIHPRPPVVCVFDFATSSEHAVYDSLVFGGLWAADGGRALLYGFGM